MRRSSKVNEHAPANTAHDLRLVQEERLCIDAHVLCKCVRVVSVEKSTWRYLHSNLHNVDAFIRVDCVGVVESSKKDMAKSAASQRPVLID